MNKRLQWILLTSVVGVVLFVAQSRFGAISYLVANDASRIVYGIMGILMAGIAWCGLKAWRGECKYPRVEFAAELSTQLGLLGTLIGLVMLFADGVGEASEVLVGLSTALTTTIAGIVSACILNLYVMVLGDKR